jgi:gamma-glutamylcyclotransferase (GGCT)/AIG2-like uncharacterized protein YtfP
MVYLFAYGTLKREEANHHLILRNRGKYLGQATSTNSRFTLQGYHFPVLLAFDEPRQYTHQVHGEVYEFVDGIPSDIDKLEGYPDFYNRKEFPYVLENGQTVLAQTYYMSFKTELQDLNTDRVKPVPDLNGIKNWSRYNDDSLKKTG